MIPLWLYQIPTWSLALLVVVFFVTLAVLGALLTRALVDRLGPADNDLANYFLAAVGIFYALLIGLIAVAVWTNYTQTQAILSTESAALADMYRDLDGYPAPARETLRGLVRRYVDEVIKEEWPVQRRGEAPQTGKLLVLAITRGWAHFEPQSEGQKTIHAECLRQLNVFLSFRRQRLESIDSNLPPVMWFVVFAGAIVTIALTWFFRSENRRLQLALTASLSAMIALVIFLIIVLDRPLVGTASLEPDNYRDLREQIIGLYEQPAP